MKQTEGSETKLGEQGWFSALPVAIGDIGGTAEGIFTILSPSGIPLGIGISGTTGIPPEPGSTGYLR